MVEVLQPNASRGLGSPEVVGVVPGGYMCA